MSYARFSHESDVYVFAHYQGFVQCCGCMISDVWDYYTVEEVVEHMRDHVLMGYKVPKRLLDPATYDEKDFEPREYD